MKLFNRILKHVVSDEDRFIHRFDFEHQKGKSRSQQKEIAKHDRIARLRDEAVVEQDTLDEVWREF
jgi:hypothetical protein